MIPAQNGSARLSAALSDGAAWKRPGLDAARRADAMSPLGSDEALSLVSG